MAAIQMDMILPFGPQVRAIDERIGPYREAMAAKLAAARADEARARAGRPTFAAGVTRTERGYTAVRLQYERLVAALDLEITRRAFQAAARQFASEGHGNPTAADLSRLVGTDYTRWRAAAYKAGVALKP